MSGSLKTASTSGGNKPTFLPLWKKTLAVSENLLTSLCIWLSYQAGFSRGTASVDCVCACVCTLHILVFSLMYIKEGDLLDQLTSWG